MDLMEIRRGLMAQMASGGNQYWKKVTLAEDHLDQSIANQKYWVDFLGISEQDDLDQYGYLCIFEHNTATGDYKINIALYIGNVCAMIRKNCLSASGNVSTSNTNYIMFATQGTIITVYKIEL